MIYKITTSNGVKKLLILLAVIFLIVSPLTVSAAAPCTIDASRDPASLPVCINQIYTWSLGAAALLGLLMTIVGGYYKMTAAGNADRSGKGDEMIWGAIIGLTILFGAYLLLNTINPDLVNFKNFNKDFTCLSNPSAAGCPQTAPTTTTAPSSVRN